MTIPPPPKTTPYYVFLFVTIILLAVSLRIYKAGQVGIIYDEAYSFFQYAGDINTALSKYSFNNHIVNSVLMSLSVKSIGRHSSLLGVPSIRVPAVVFGIIYVLSVSLVIHHVLNNMLLKLVLLVPVLFNYFIVDISYLARGYVISLGAAYLGILLLVLYEKNKTMNIADILLSIGLLNGIAIGAFATSVFLMVSINIVFLAVVYHKIYTESAIESSTKALKTTIIIGVVLAVLTSLLLILIYSKSFSHMMDIVDRSRRPGNKLIPFYMGVLKDFSFNPGNSLFEPDSAIFVILSSIFFTLYFLGLITRKRINNTSAMVFSLMIISVVVCLIFVLIKETTSDITRSYLIYLPLILVTGGVMFDEGLRLYIDAPIKKYLLVFTFVCLYAIFIVNTMPSIKTINICGWADQSSAYVLTKELKALDPQRQWRVCPSNELIYTRLPWLFYNDRKMERTSEDADVLLLHLSEKTLPDYRYYKYELFKLYNVLVYIR
jgi:hypothetical protein